VTDRRRALGDPWSGIEKLSRLSERRVVELDCGTAHRFQFLDRLRVGHGIGGIAEEVERLGYAELKGLAESSDGIDRRQRVPNEIGIDA